MTLQDGLSIGAMGHLYIGGCDTVSLVAEYGSPLYVYDEATLRNRCKAFVQAMEAHAPGGLVAYASKAFCTAAMCAIVRKEGLGLDVVSSGELYTAIKADFPMERVLLHGSNKTDEELHMAIAHGVGRIVIDHREEIARIEAMASAMNETVRVMVRVNPDIDVHTHRAVQTARADCKFGLSITDGEALHAIQAISDCAHLRLTGLHVHLGSQILDTHPYEQAVHKLTDLMVLATLVTQREMEEINVGGGFGVRYTEADDPVAPEDFIAVIAQCVSKRCRAAHIRVPRLIIEPGRAIVAEAGVMLYTVGAIKEMLHLHKLVSVDGGMADNPRPALYGSRYRALLANRAREAASESVTIVGRCCETGDILMHDAWLPAVRRGDILAMFTAGAYQYAMASNYNRLPVPAAVLVRYGKADLMVARQTVEDITHYDRMPKWL